MMRARRALLGLCLVAALLAVTGCQRSVDVKTGTRVVDAQGNVVSERVRTVRTTMAEASKYRIRTVDQEAMLAPLYAEAQAAIAAGDLKTAENRLAQVLEISPIYRNAQKQYDQLRAGKKVAADKGTGNTTTTPGTPAPSTSDPDSDPEEPSQPDTGLLRWIPDNLQGFTASKALVDPLSVSRQYRPASGQDVATLIIAAEQFRTASDANRALADKVKGYYRKNPDNFNLGGHKVYFGTDGRHFAVIGFTDGAVMVAVEGSVDSGSPTALKDLLRGIVEQLP